MTTADKWVRGTTLAAAIIVAAIAGWISYRHAVAVVVAHGEPGLVGHFYPATIDGLIIAASMVLLDSAQHGTRPPRLALWFLSAGIAATLAANILAGLHSGPLGAVISAWPAPAFIGCYEMLMALVRSAAQRETVATTETDQPTDDMWVPEDALDAAFEAMRMSIAVGNPFPINRLQTKFNLTRAQATQIRTEVLAASNGHAIEGVKDVS